MRPDFLAWARSWRGLGLVGLTALGMVAPTFFWWAGLAWLLRPERDLSPGRMLLGVAWIGLSILTPFYRPYVRLWLPIHSLGWIAAAGMIHDLVQARGDTPVRPASRSIVVAVCIAGALIQGLVLMRTPSPTERGAGLLAPSDSLRSAVGRVIADLPRDLSGLRLLVRPPVTFYLGGRAGARVEPDLDALLRDQGGGAWALVDLAQLRQSGDVEATSARVLKRWERVGIYPTALNLPTLLDVDPGAARAARPGEADAPLWLLRPRGTGGNR
jgi:hypothetical protein